MRGAFRSDGCADRLARRHFLTRAILFAPVWGKVSDRLGRKPVLLLGLFGTVVGYVLMGLATSVAMLFVARLIDGISGANIGAAQAYLADISAPENRARAMGLLGAAFGLDSSLVQRWEAGRAWHFNYAAPMFIAGRTFAGEFLFVMFCLPESRRSDEQRAQGEPIFPNLFDHVERSTYAWSLASYFLVIVGFSMMTALFALLLFHRFGLDALHTGYVLGAIGILGVIIQGGLIGRLVRRFGEAPIALAGTVSMCAGLCALALSSGVGTHVCRQRLCWHRKQPAHADSFLSRVAERRVELARTRLGPDAVQWQSGALAWTDACRSAPQCATSPGRRELRTLAALYRSSLSVGGGTGCLPARRARSSLGGCGSSRVRPAAFPEMLAKHQECS